MKISELQLKLYLTTLPEVREQCGTTIREHMSTLDNAVMGCNCLFEHAMELWTTLQEESNLQRLGTVIQVDIGDHPLISLGPPPLFLSVFQFPYL